MSLIGKVALVTGGSRGIGRAIALELAAAGAKVAICHDDDPAAAETIEEINKVSEGMQKIADVSDEGDVISFFEAAASSFGRIDILVNNAGILRESPLVETEAADSIPPFMNYQHSCGSPSFFSQIPGQ